MTQRAVEAIYTRDPELMRRLGATPALMPVLFANAGHKPWCERTHLFLVDATNRCGPLQWELQPGLFDDPQDWEDLA
jgi:hypothetical protein